MRTNAGIILGGQSPNLLSAIEQGQIAGQMDNEIQRQNALADLYRAQGQGILAGETSALNALAQISPDAALGVQTTQQGMDATALGMDATRQNMSIQRATQARLSREEQRAIEAHAASMSAAQAAQARLDIENDLAVLMTAQTPEQWDVLSQQTGNPDFVGQFGQRETVIAPYIGLAEVLERQQVEGPQSSLGKFYADQSAGLIPGDAQPPQGGTNVNINTGDPAPQVGSIPQGYALAPDQADPSGYRMVPIPGGPADTTANEAAAAESDALQAQVVLGASQAIRDKITGGGFFDLPEVGIVGSRLGGLGLNQEATDVKNNFSVLQSAVSFDRLQRMREASPTGGALGAVSERELNLLQASMGALDQSSSKEQVLETLDLLDSVMKKFDAYPAGGQPAAEQATGRASEIANWSRDQILSADPGTMTLDEINAWNARMDALGL